MSVPNQTPYNIYTANGQTTVFPYEFYLLNSGDLTVSIDGAEVTSGYTVSGVGNVDGGDVTFLTAPANGVTVLLQRNIPSARTIDYQDNGDLLADTVNKDFDRLWMAIRQAYLYLGFALTRPIWGGPFDAQGYRIANLGNPVNAQDAVTKGYVDSSSSSNNNYADALFKRTLRFPDNVNQMPPVAVRGHSLQGYNDQGQPVPVFSMTDTADLALKLASLTGSALIGGLGYLTPEMFGAKGDGVTDDRPAIQSAINKANANYLAGTGPRTVYLGSRYRVTLNPASTLIPGEVAAGRGVLNIRAGVSIEGPGTLALDKSFTGGSSGAVITNWEGPADHCSVKGITIDGGYGEAVGYGISGINILGSEDVEIILSKIFNSTAGGIYLRRAGDSSSDYGCSNSKILGCRVDNARYIGIQCERPNGMIVANNIITNIGDNGVDIEGNQSGITTTGYAEGVIIAANKMSGVKNGIFIESCGQAKVVNNTIYTPGIGIVLNRINSGSFYNEVINNTITGKGIDDSGMGMRFINQIGRTRVAENRIRLKVNGIHFADRIDRMDVGVNFLSDITTTILAFDKVNSGVSMLRSRIASQFYAGGQTSGLPYPTSPRNNPANYPNRMASTVSYEPVHFSDLAGPGEENMVYRTATLSYNSSWAAYARYGIVTAGYTSLNGNFGNAGDYLEINGSYYQIYSVETSTTEILKWDGSSWASGNFVGDFTDAFTVKTHRSVWGTL